MLYHIVDGEKIQILSIHDPFITRAFGINPCWSGYFHNYIWALVYTNTINLQVKGPNEILSNYLKEAFRNYGLTQLNLHNTNFPCFGPFRIRMTGSRRSDAESAFRKLFTKFNILNLQNNYCWHHAAGISHSGGKIYCNMYYIDAAYHKAHRHYGAVNEYKMVFSNGYRNDDY